MTNERIIPITTDAIITIMLTDLYYSHTRDDLRDSIDAADDLMHFCDMNLDDMRDADDLYSILAIDDDDFDLIADILRDDALRIHTAMMNFLTSLDY